MPEYSSDLTAKFALSQMDQQGNTKKHIQYPNTKLSVA
jgi:hypothetical protein